MDDLMRLMCMAGCWSLELKGILCWTVYTKDVAVKNVIISMVIFTDS